MILQAWDKYSYQLMMVVSIIGADFTGCNLILKILWLQTVKSTIKWKDENLIFPEPDSKLPVRDKPKKVQKPKVNARCKSSYSFTDTQPPNIAMIGLKELAAVCEAKSLDAFITDWRDLKNVVSEKWEKDDIINVLMGAVITPNNVIKKPSSTILLEKYSDFLDVFDKVRADKLLHYSEHNLAIEIEEGKQPPFSPTYDHSQLELEVFCKYINKMLGKRFIVSLKSPARALVFLTKKKDSGLCLCIDYRSLNAITKKNKHPLPLVQTLLDFLKRKKRYTKLDIISAYHALRICAGNEWKTAFQCRYGHFKYCIVLFGLVNAPAAFQAYINLALCKYMDQFVVAYFDNIVVYSDIVKEHTQHVQLVLQRLRKFNLFVKLSKCIFDALEIEFVGFIVGQKGISIDLGRIKIVVEWLLSKLFKDIQKFLRFANFYC